MLPNLTLEQPKTQRVGRRPTEVSNNRKCDPKKLTPMQTQRGSLLGTLTEKGKGLDLFTLKDVISLSKKHTNDFGDKIKGHRQARRNSDPNQEAVSMAAHFDNAKKEQEHAIGLRFRAMLRVGMLVKRKLRRTRAGFAIKAAWGAAAAALEAEKVAFDAINVAILVKRDRAQKCITLPQEVVEPCATLFSRQDQGGMKFTGDVLLKFNAVGHLSPSHKRAVQLPSAFDRDMSINAPRERALREAYKAADGAAKAGQAALARAHSCVQVAKTIVASKVVPHANTMRRICHNQGTEDPKEAAADAAWVAIVARQGADRAVEWAEFCLDESKVSAYQSASAAAAEIGMVAAKVAEVLAKATDEMLFRMGSELSSSDTVTVRLKREKAPYEKGDGWLDGADLQETEDVDLDMYCKRMQGLITLFEKAHGEKTANAKSDEEAGGGDTAHAMDGTLPAANRDTPAGRGQERGHGIHGGGTMRATSTGPIVLGRSSAGATTSLSQTSRRRSPRRQGRRQAPRQACLPEPNDSEIDFHCTKRYGSKKMALSRTVPARYGSIRNGGSVPNLGVLIVPGEHRRQQRGSSSIQVPNNSPVNRQQAWSSPVNRFPSASSTSSRAQNRKGKPQLTLDTKAAPSLERRHMGSPNRVSSLSSMASSPVRLSLQLPTPGTGHR
jgi:hypothetical protein